MKVKIILDKNETIHEAEEMLFKALDMHRNGDHIRESFEDPGLIDVEQRVAKVQKDIYQDMLDEITEALDEEYRGNF